MSMVFFFYFSLVQISSHGCDRCRDGDPPACREQCSVWHEQDSGLTAELHLYRLDTSEKEKGSTTLGLYWPSLNLMKLPFCLFHRLTQRLKMFSKAANRLQSAPSYSVTRCLLLLILWITPSLKISVRKSQHYFRCIISFSITGFFFISSQPFSEWLHQKLHFDPCKWC